jgi:predicted small integral membrane protein
LVALTVRLTVAVLVELPLVPVTVMACAPEGNAMFAAVVMVKVTVIVWRGLPSSVTLGGLKLQSAPAGRFTVQLLGLDAVEFVKLTDPVKPLVGVMVSVEIALCPAGMLKLDGLADMVNGAATVTVAGEDVEGALIPL